jgi:predicted phage terminase large subunit-like protein
MEIVLPELHSSQTQAQKSTARFRVLSCGRRWGKGVLGVSEAFRRGIGGGKCRFIAPSYASDSYQSAWNLATLFAGQIPGARVHLQRRQIDFVGLGGGWLQLRTAEEPDALRGEGIDFCIFDEAAHIQNLEEMWEQCVRPSLMDRRGSAWFISTPKGYNFFNTLFLRARDDSDWASFQFPTSSSPYIGADEIEALRSSMPALVARQEIDAEFVQLAGALFLRANIRVLEAEPPGIAWVRSWDLAWTERTTSDFTAGVKMGMMADGTVVVADVIHLRAEWPAIVRLIADTARWDGRSVRQGVEVVGAQAAAVQTLLADPMLVAHTIVPITVIKDKLSRALPLVARSEQGKFAIVRANWNQKFLDELCSFGAGARHDDQVDACSGGMTLLSLPTGAIVDPDRIRFERSTLLLPWRVRRFTPRSTEQGARLGYFET